MVFNFIFLHDNDYNDHLTDIAYPWPRQVNRGWILFGDLAGLAATAWDVGPSVTVPLFEGGRLKGQLELREAQQREAAVTFQKTVLQAQRRRTDLARAVGQNEAALAAARQRYREGLVDFLNVNQAEVQLLSSQNDFADAETQIATDLVELYRALVGGWMWRTGRAPSTTRPRSDRRAPSRR